MIKRLYRTRVFLGLGIFFSFLPGCAQLNVESLDELRMLEGRVLYKDSREPLVGIEVVLLKLKKPLLSMRGWEKIDAAKTNEEGYFQFEISEVGPYEIRWNPESDLIPHELPVAEFEGRKVIEILHTDKARKAYPWEGQRS